MTSLKKTLRWGVFACALSLSCSSGQGGELTASQGEALLGTDLTGSGTAVALVTMPTGGGNHSLSVIHDGVFPVVGSSNSAQEYDTYTNAFPPKPADWLGYTFSSAQTFGAVVFQDGKQFSNGGYYASTPFIEVQQSGVWSTVPGQSISPAYAGNDGVNFETYTFSFPPVTGTGIRVNGPPGGSNVFISCGELRVYAPAASDGGSEAGLDATTDAPFEAAEDAVVEAQMEATLDAGSESSADVTVDATDGGGGSSFDGGCGLSGVSSGQYAANITVGGMVRSYTVIVPTSYSSSVAVPLVFVFHGFNQFASDAVNFGLQGAATSPAIFVFPQGYGRSDESGQSDWDRDCAGLDAPFFDALRAQLYGQYCISTTLVSGFSAGADFTDALGCCRGSQIRAVAPASGGFYDLVDTCTTPAPAYRLTSGGQDQFYQQYEFLNGVEHYRSASVCSGPVVTSGAAPCAAYSNCMAPVIWCEYGTMTHDRPATWAVDTWAFFASLP